MSILHKVADIWFALEESYSKECNRNPVSKRDYLLKLLNSKDGEPNVTSLLQVLGKDSREYNEQDTEIYTKLVKIINNAAKKIIDFKEEIKDLDSFVGDENDTFSFSLDELNVFCDVKRSTGRDLIRSGIFCSSCNANQIAVLDANDRDLVAVPNKFRLAALLSEIMDEEFNFRHVAANLAKEFLKSGKVVENMSFVNGNVFERNNSTLMLDGYFIDLKNVEFKSFNSVDIASRDAKIKADINYCILPQLTGGPEVVIVL